jgi:hypothetical protein
MAAAAPLIGTTGLINTANQPPAPHVVYAQKNSKFKQRQSCHEEEVFSVVEEI